MAFIDSLSAQNSYFNLQVKQSKHKLFYFLVRFSQESLTKTLFSHKTKHLLMRYEA